MKDTSPTSVLCWPKRLLSADDLRRHLTSQRELVLLPKTIVTPLAADELRAKGVRIRWEHAAQASEASVKWFCVHEKPSTSVQPVLQALDRERIALASMDGTARTLAEFVVNRNVGGVVFTSDAAKAVCIANKIAGVRAAFVANVAHVKNAQKNIGANLYAIELPGPSFFEVKQMLKTIVTGPVQSPDEIAKTLKELDGHAHR
ncbi:MAG TPA: hypothetical protein VKE42_07315 [Candidatus Cybelea sp.]|nr:hypothetical protein [Candidatus Cybelea sp.]